MHEAAFSKGENEEKKTTNQLISENNGIADNNE